MPFRDLTGKPLRTESGREVPTPTVRSFFRALEVYGEEIGSLREFARKTPGGVTPALAVVPFLLAPGDGRIGYVLDAAVDASEAAETLAAVAGYVSPLADQIDGLLGEPSAEMVDDGDVDPGMLLVLGCADRFHIDPRTVLDWPLGIFLDCIAAFSRPEREKSAPASTEFIGGIFPTLDSTGEPVFPAEQ